MIATELALHYKTQEQNRLNFLMETRGAEAARAFAAQTYKLYREALEKGGYGREFRVPLLCSCVILRRFVRERPGRDWSGLDLHNADVGK